ncbi:MAG TPA: single-stranded DNA-binding protein [bacterium]|nr:single-stranded DNA-binding protein [bacterium]
MLNRIILIGRLTRDPELRYVPSGQPVASFTLAVDRPFVNQQGERATDFIDIVAWRKLAEQVTQHLAKGRLVAVEGRLQIRSYETQDGQKRKVAEVVADAVRFLDRKGTTSPEPASPETAEVGTEAAGPGPQEDVPF